jgi:hypothetical protein
VEKLAETRRFSDTDAARAHYRAQPSLALAGLPLCFLTTYRLFARSIRHPGYRLFA